jgi:hypothetical protein
MAVVASTGCRRIRFAAGGCLDPVLPAAPPSGTCRRTQAVPPAIGVRIGRADRRLHRDAAGEVEILPSARPPAPTVKSRFCRQRVAGVRDEIKVLPVPRHRRPGGRGPDGRTRITESSLRSARRRQDHQQLQAGAAAAQGIALEIRRNVDHEGQFAGIHQVVHIAFADLDRPLEPRRQECVGDAAGQLGTMLIDNADGGVVDLSRAM